MEERLISISFSFFFLANFQKICFTLSLCQHLRCAHAVNPPPRLWAKLDVVTITLHAAATEKLLISCRGEECGRKCHVWGPDVVWISDAESLPDRLSLRWRVGGMLGGSGGGQTGAAELCKCQEMKHCLYANPKHYTDCAAHSALSRICHTF